MHIRLCVYLLPSVPYVDVPTVVLPLAHFIKRHISARQGSCSIHLSTWIPKTRENSRLSSPLTSFLSPWSINQYHSFHSFWLHYLSLRSLIMYIQTFISNLNEIIWQSPLQPGDHIIYHTTYQTSDVQTTTSIRRTTNPNWQSPKFRDHITFEEDVRPMSSSISTFFLIVAKLRSTRSGHTKKHMSISRITSHHITHITSIAGCSTIHDLSG